MRYAIYFTPPEDHALTRCAAAWLGRDAFHDLTLAQADVEGFDAAEIAALTAEPRRYGFHATLKAPFALAVERDEQDLVQAFQAFAADTRQFTLPAITLGQLGPFFALVPADWSEELQGFADACVRQFEPFRAPLSAADIARRNPESLSASQRHQLEHWGYPYVFEDFRFHMTLTGPVPKDRQPAIKGVLEGAFRPFIGQPLDISNLALFIEPERGAPFVLKSIAPLRPAPQRKTA